MTIREVLETHPRPPAADREALLRCVEACGDCSGTCTACADACLGEGDVPEMVRCVRRCLDCADACTAAGRIVTRGTEPDVRVIASTVEACAVACRSCAEECGRHARHHEHCRICAEACRRCEEACDALLAALAPA
jgi:Domain of Unknown Function (DUF326)